MRLEKALGLVAGVLGIIFAVLNFGLATILGFLEAFVGEQISIIEYYSIVTAEFFLSAITIVGAAIVDSKPKAAGVTMLLTGVLGIPAIRGFYLTPFLAIIAGLIALVRRRR